MDKNIPFYIGIGTVHNKSKGFRNRYRRAFLRSRRNPYWKNIVNVTEYQVEILFESEDYDFIKEKEKEFISLYGLENLSNMTEGGEGSRGYRFNDDQKKLMSLSRKGRKSNCKKIGQYTLNGEFIREWPDGVSAANSLGCTKSNINKVVRGKSKSCKGYKWKTI